MVPTSGFSFDSLYTRVGLEGHISMRQTVPAGIANSELSLTQAYLRDVAQLNMLCVTIFLFLCVLSNVDAKYVQPLEHLEDERIYKKYVEMDENVKILVNRGVKMLLPYIMEAANLNLSASCKRDAFRLLSGIRKLELPALNILDAAGKLDAGLFAGNVHSLGDYDECMTTSVTLKNGSVAFKGQYCLLNIRALLPKRINRLTTRTKLEGLVKATENSSELTQYITSLAQVFYDFPAKFGICVPSGCSSKDVHLVLNYLSDKTYINVSVAYCNQQDTPNVTVGMIIAIGIYSVLGILVLTGSFMDYYSKKNEVTFKSISARLFLCFSVLSNFPKAISAKSPHDSLSSLFGIRSLSLFYIILFHEYLLKEAFQTQGHALRSMEETQQFFSQSVQNAVLTVDVFFFLGGCLNSYNRLKTPENERGALHRMIHRLWRISPAYLFSIVTSYLLANSHGPHTTAITEYYWDNCESQWWRNILFINNFYSQKDTCMGHSWYIAADMQLFLLSLITVPVLLRCAKKGIILHSAILMSGITVTVLWAWQKGILPTILFTELDLNEKFQAWDYYSTTFPHVAPYFAGIITGYILAVWKDMKISVFSQIIGWSVASTCFISMLFITRIWNTGAEYTAMENILYFAFSKFVYVLAVAWLVVCCVRGYGGILNYILSLKIWIPISRLSYTMYLISLPIQLFYYGNLRMVIDNSRMTIIWRYLATLSITGLVALLMVLLVELPFFAMEKFLYKRKNVAKEESHANSCDVKAKQQEMTIGMTPLKLNEP